MTLRKKKKLQIMTLGRITTIEAKRQSSAFRNKNANKTKAQSDGPNE